MCKRPNCMFRHMNVTADRDRKSTPCYWEHQPGGCKKPHCPFFHEKLRDPYPEPVTALIQPGGKIIVNKNKLAELGNLILPVTLANSETADTTTVNHKQVQFKLYGAQYTPQTVLVGCCDNPQNNNMPNGNCRNFQGMLVHVFLNSIIIEVATEELFKFLQLFTS